MRSESTVALLVVSVCSLLAGCADAPDPYTDDVPTKGHVLIMADEDLRSVVESQEFVFESIYAKAELDIRYYPEADLLKAVLNDSVRCWIASVEPGGDQEAYYAERTIRPHVVPIFTDAIAVVVNQRRKLERISLPLLRSILFNQSQRGPDWRMVLGTGDERDAIAPFIANAGSGAARALRDSLMGPEWSGPFRAQALTSLEDVIARVEADSSAMGFVPFSAFSDLDNPPMKAMRARIRLVAVSQNDSSAAFLPNQSTLADGSYPLRRPVHMVLAEGKSGLGTGFVSFVANHKGQRIILKQGLAPTKVPTRDVLIVDP
jgi:phosphate transport system substrate-binding protein